MRPRYPGTPSPLILVTFPVNAQIATNSKRALQLGRDFAINGGFETVPIEGGNKHHQNHDDQQHDAANPAKCFACSCHNGSLEAIADCSN
ncbi:hypothetical protein D3C76_1766780 [compost metagenome]